MHRAFTGSRLATFPKELAFQIAQPSVLDTALADIEAGKGEPLDDVVAKLKADVRQHYQLD